MLWRTKRANGNREPEFRLPFAIPGVLVAVRDVLPDRRVSRCLTDIGLSTPAGRRYYHLRSSAAEHTGRGLGERGGHLRLSLTSIAR